MAQHRAAEFCARRGVGAAVAFVVVRSRPRGRNRKGPTPPTFGRALPLKTFERHFLPTLLAITVSLFARAVPRALVNRRGVLGHRLAKADLKTSVLAQRFSELDRRIRCR